MYKRQVLPRAADDEATARALSSVLPVVLEQADYEQVYSDCWWRKLKQGTGVTGVFWDPAARGGVGEIAVRAMNLLMLYLSLIHIYRCRWERSCRSG